jgi:hypothetical protein
LLPSQSKPSKFSSTFFSFFQKVSYSPLFHQLQHIALLVVLSLHHHTKTQCVYYVSGMKMSSLHLGVWDIHMLQLH